MFRHLFHRFLLLLFLLFSTTTLVFFLLHAVPGEPTLGLLGSNAHSDSLQQVQEDLNTHGTISSQYKNHLTDLLHFSLGRSIFNGRTVWSNIAAVMPDTLLLTLVSLCVAFITALPVGIAAAYKENGIHDAILTLFSSVGLGIPVFFLGPLLIIVFSLKLHWFPISDHNTTSGLVLPAATLALPLFAWLTRIIKHTTAVELRKPYVLLARTKGLKEFQLIKNYLLKNALMPVITTIGLQLGALLSGTVITETIFARQGLGSLLVVAIKQRDYPMIQGALLVITTIYLLLSFLVDSSYFIIDPRTRKK